MDYYRSGIPTRLLRPEANPVKPVSGAIDRRVLGELSRNYVNTVSAYKKEKRSYLNDEPMDLSDVTPKAKKTFFMSPQMDAQNEDNPQYCTSIIKEIYAELRTREAKYLPTPEYMNNHRELNWKTRKILVDWLVGVHDKFKLRQETLYLTINIIDRFLSIRTCRRNKFQLFGVACLLIASKYEEIYPPEIRHLIDVSANSFNKEELLQMESFVLTVLDFNLTVVTVYPFLRRFARAADCDQKATLIAYYLSELAILDNRNVGTKSSKIAAACVYLAKRLRGSGDPFADTSLSYYSEYTLADIDTVVQNIVDYTANEMNFRTSDTNNVSKKYSRQRRYGVSLKVPQKIVKIFS